MQSEGKLILPQGVKKTTELQPDRIEFICLPITYIQRVLQSLKDTEKLESDNLNLCFQTVTTHFVFEM